MKLANRIGAAVLATAMVGTLLTGCGGGSASTTASTGDGTAAASSTESSGDGDNTYTMFMRSTYVDWIKELKWYDVAEERTGIHVDYIPGPEEFNDVYSEIDQRVISGDLPDAVMTKLAQTNVYGPQGVFADLAPYIEKYAPNLQKYIDDNPDYKALVTDKDGHIYGLCKETPIFADLIGYRVDQFKAAGIDPDSIVTIDDFTKALETLKAYYGKDNPNYYPLTGRDTAIRFASWFGAASNISSTESNGIYINGHYKDGSIDIMNDGAYKMVETMKKWYDEGLIQPKWVAVEASLRRFAHYDYWLDTVLPSIAEDSGADLISFGMGEHQTVAIAKRLAAGEPVSSITDVDGTCYLTDFDHLPEKYVECAGFKKVASDKVAYAKACRIQMDNQDVVSGQIIVQKQSEKYLVQNIPAKPLVRWELDKVYALPYTRRYHPIYEAMGGVPAIREVQFSIIQNRGCFGGCNFCAIQLHQGRRVTSRSADSIVEEAERMTHEPDFKGYIHDVGGPTANFRFPSCREQMLRGMCSGGKHCLAPTTCSHMIVDHSDYLKILRRVRELPGVKKVFIRSGIRFDYLMADPDDTFFKELVEYHVSGQLKVAPEHCAPNTLAYMGKPPIQTFNKFKDKFYELSKKAGKKQYLVPYLMSSHPGSTLNDAVYLAEYLYKNHMRPEQVQDFYPTPGTVSTCMFYTGLDPYTLKPVFVEKTAEGKALQRALLQYYEPRNAEKVIKALKMTHREDLIPLLVPAEGRRAVQRSARRAEAAEVTIHNDGTYTVRPNGKGGKGKTANRAAAPAGRQPSPGARFAPHAAPGHKPKNNQQKENTTWKTTKRKK